MNPEISLGNATSAAITGHTTPEEIIRDIKNGRWAKQVAAVRAATGDEASELKKKLPAVLWAGTFSTRKNAGLIQASGLICADLDKIPDRVGELHDLASNDPHAVAAFVSPSGNGLKIVFRAGDFAAVRSHVAGHYNAQVDEAAKDVARLCFVSHDQAAFFKPDALPLQSIPDIAPVARKAAPPANFAPSSRAQIAERILGKIQWADDGGFCKCPGEHLHTSANGERDCKVLLTGAPTIKCFHASCAGIVEGVNHELRSQIGKAELPAKRNGFAAEYLPSADEVAAPTNGGRPLPEILDAAEFLAAPIEPPAELVAEILHKGSKLAFGGSSKSFKTWNLLDLALSISSGTKWLGRETAQGKVLFVNFEIQPHAWQRRIAAVADAKGIKLQAGQIHLWNLRGHAADFRKIIPRMIERCRAENYALAVLDPIYKLYGGTDENAAGDVAALLNEIERLAAETGAAVAFGAHFAKGNASAKEAIDRISGSGVFARDPTAF